MYITVYYIAYLYIYIYIYRERDTYYRYHTLIYDIPTARCRCWNRDSPPPAAGLGSEQPWANPVSKLYCMILCDAILFDIMLCYTI